jgi:hypothetical protein
VPVSLKLPSDVRKEDGRWLRECPVCCAEISHLRRNYCVHASLLKQPCKRCSNMNNHPAGMVGSVRVAWYNSFYKSAVSRGYEWSISIEFIDSLYSVQAGRCALTGIPIEWSAQGWNHTASIDRIDNNNGYTEDNIQLVHKEVNMLRGSLPVERLVELSRLIVETADKVKW